MKKIFTNFACSKSVPTRTWLLVIIFLFFSVSLFATTGTFSWTGGGANNNWSNTSNWSVTSGSGTYPGAGTNDVVQFTNVTATVTVDVTPATLASITFYGSTVQFVGTVATTQTTTSSGIASGNTTVTLSAANASIAANQQVAITSGTGTIPQYASVVTYTSGGPTIALSNAPTASNSAATTLTFYNVAPTITTTNCYFTNNNTVILGGAFTVSTSLDFSNSTGAGSKLYLPNTQYLTVGGLAGMSTTNVFSGSANPQLKFSGSTGTAYFDAAAPSFFGLYVNNSITATLGNSVTTARLSYGTFSKIVLTNSGTILSHTFGGTSTYSGLGIDASASGTGIQFVGTFALPSNYFANTTVNTLTMNKASNYVTLAQNLSVTNLNLTAGLLDNSTNTVTVANGGTIQKGAGNLKVAPMYGTTSSDKINVTYTASVSTGLELQGTTGSVGTVTVNDGVTTTLSNSGINNVTPTTAFPTSSNNYTSPSIIFGAPSTGGVTATGTVITSGSGATRNIVGIIITNPGSGYTSAPTCTISDGTGPTISSFTIGLNSTNPSVTNVTIGSGTSGVLTYPNSTNAVTLNITSGVTVNVGASFNCGTQSGTVTHLLNVGGSITNSGTFNLYNAATGYVDANLNGGNTQTLTGTFTFNNLTISNANANLAASAAITTKAALIVAANFTQPVNSTISSFSLTVNSNKTFTISGTSASSLSTASATNAVFTLSTSNGTVNNNGTITVNGWMTSNITSVSSVYSGSGTITFNNYSVFQQAVSEGTIPTATWNTGSTLYFTGTAGTAPTIPASTYANIIWNCASQSTSTGMVLNPTSISGALVVLNTNTKTLTLSTTSTASTTINVGSITVGSGTGGYSFNGASITTAAATSLVFYSTNTSAPTISVSGDINVQGYNATGTATLSNTNACTLNAQGNFTLAPSNSTFTSTNTTVNFNGTSGTLQTISGTITFAGLTISNTTASVVVGSGGLTIASGNTLTISNSAVLDMASYTLTVSTITTSGSGTLKTQNTSATPITTGKTWSFNVIYNNLTGAQTVMAGTYNGGLTMSNTSGINTASGSLVLANVPLTLNSGSTLDLGASYSISVSNTTGNIGSTGSGTLKTGNINSPTYKLTSGLTWGGTVVYYILGNPRIVPGSYTNLTVDNATSGVTGHAINWGNGVASNETISISGIFSIDNITSFTAYSNNVQFTGSNQSVVSLYGSYPTNNISFYNLDISGATGFTFPSGTTNISNTFIPGTNTSDYATQGTINFNNLTGGQTIPAFTYYSLAFGNTSGTQTASGAIVVKSNLTLPTSTGVFDVSASNYPVSIGGNWVSSVSSSFNAESGTVTFNGTGTQTISGTNTFYNLTDVTGGATLTLTAGTTQTITNILTLTGALGNLLNFKSSTSAVAYITLTNYANTAISYCNITYITNNSTTVNAASSTNGGNNTNIKFNNVWIGGTSGSWNTATNWGSGTVPTSGDDVIFDNSIAGNTSPTVSFTSNPVAGSLTFNNSNVTFTYNATLTAPLTVSGSVTLNGSVVSMGTGTSLTTPSTSVANNGIGLQVGASSIAGTLTLASTNVGSVIYSRLYLCNYQSSTATTNTLYGPVAMDANDYLGEATTGIAPALVYAYAPTTIGSSTFYFDPNLQTPLFKLTSSGAKQTLALGSNLYTSRVVLGSSNLNTASNPAINLNGNILTIGTGTSTYTAGTINANIGQISFDNTIAPSIGYALFTPSTVNSLVDSCAGLTLAFSQPLTITNLYLKTGALDNSTNNITIPIGGNVYAYGGTLNAAPAFAGTANVTVNASCTAGNELQGTGGSVGALNVNTGTYTLASTSSVASVNIANGATLSYPNSGTAITLTVTGDVATNTSGTLTAGTQTSAVLHQLVLGGNVTGSGTLSLTGSGTTKAVDVTFNNASSSTITSGTLSFNSVTLNKSTGITLGGSGSIANNLTLANGTLTVGANTLTLAGVAPSLTSGNIDASNSSATVLFTNTTSITLPAGLFTDNINNFTVNGAGRVVLGEALTISGNLILTTGALDISSSNYAISLGGNLIITGGNLIPRSGTVTLNGSGTQTISSGLTFNSLYVYNGSVVIPALLTASNITIGDGTHTMSLTQPTATLVSVTNAFAVSSSANYTIAAGTGSSVSAGTNNAVLNFNSANGTITNNGTIAINGWFTNGNQNSTTATTLAGSGTWTIGSQGVYNHNTINGTIPTMTSWVAGSTLYYTGTHGANTLAAGTNQSFRKVIYNCPTNPSSANYFNPSAILDTLYIVNSGTATPRTFQIENSVSTVSIGTLIVGTGAGSYYFNGGISSSNPVVVSLGTTTAPTITVARDVTVQGNSSINTATLTTSSGSSILNLGGNLNVGSNAYFTTTNITVNLDGSGTSSTPQTITSSGQTFTALTVSNATYATLANTIAVMGSLTLTSGTLNDGGNTVTVNGSITGAGTHTGSGQLIITGGTATHYIGSSSGTINLGNVQINSSSYILGLAGNAVINGTMTLTAGLFNIYSYNLTLANAPVGYTSSSYIYHYSTGNGTLTINNVGSGSTVFPVGISANYVPITFTGTTNSPNVTVGFGLTLTNAPLNASNIVNVQWSILSSTASSTTPTFQYSSNNQASGYLPTSTIVVGAYSGSAYSENLLGVISGSSPYTVSTTSAIALTTSLASLYAIGNQYSFAPGAPSPSITYLTGGNNQATIGFSAVTNGSSIITNGYSVTPYIGGVAQTTITGINSSPYIVTGLTNGTTYTFKVSATNSVGTGTSALSNSVTIAVPTIYDSILTNRTAAIQLNTPSIATSLISATYGYINGGILSDSTFSSLGEPPTLTSPNKDLYYFNYLSLIQNMAEVYTYNYTYIKNGVNETGYNNPAVLAAIKQTLTWWLQRVPYYTCNNWHYATITYPLNLGNVLVLMRGIGVNVDTTGWGAIEKNAINLVYANPETPNTGLIANGYLSPSTNTGDNRTNISDYWLDWGCLTKNVNSNGWDVVDTAINELYTTMDYTQSLPDGYKQDNSFMQHYAQDYTQQYGGGWAYDILAFGNYLKNTSKAMTQTKLDLMYNYVHNSYYASARGIYKDFNLNGREISIPNNNLVDSTIAEMGALVDPTPSHISDYKTDLANCETSNPNYVGDTIHTHYFVSDYTLHKRPNYNFSVRSVSTRTNMDESLNTQNLLGTFLAQGATSIMVHGNENNNSFANWNWNYVPGVTTSDSLDGSGNSATQQNPNYGQYDTGYTRFVGGVSDGKYGASTLSLSYDHVTGNKSWFFFDSAVVCLGANIQSAKTGMNTVTSVNQQLINGPIYYNNSAGGSYTTFTAPTDANPATVSGTNIYSVFHDSIGYFFPTGNNVTIKQDSVYGDWYNIDNLYISSIPDTTDMFQLSINHGVAPSNGSYQYIVAPGISYSTMQTYNPLNTINILANTKYVQAVKHNGLNMMQVIFDSATSITDPTSGITVKVNQPCALMLSNMNQNPLTVTVSDPTQLLSTLTVTMSYSSNTSQFNLVTETLPSGYFVGSSVSFTVDSTSANSNLWIGATSTSYNTASNWQSGVVPSSGANITIASGATYYPVLNSSAATTLNNLTLTSGSFTVNSTDTLKVRGAINNTSGTVTVNGTVSYSGTTAQTIAANTFASNTVNNISINNTSGVTLAGALYVAGTVYSTSGTLNSNGNLTLLSTSTGTARMDQIAGGIAGDVTVQRYITAKTARKYSYIGSPVTASVRNSWQQQIYVTGAGTGGVPCGTTNGDGGSNDKYNSNGFDVTQNSAASIYKYNATLVNGSRYVGIANTESTNLSPGTGYCVNIRGNRNSNTVNCVNQLESNTPAAPEAVTLSATGPVTTGDLSVTLNNPSVYAFTLLANPYPCQISFSAFQASNSNINNNMWTYSPFGNNNYTTYSNGIIANGASSYDNTSGNYIASGQAFFVQANAPGSVTFHESHKTNGALPGTQYFGTDVNRIIRIGLKDNSETSLLDEIVVRYNSNGSDVYTQGWDASSLSSGSQILASLKGTKRLAIATHGEVLTTDTTKLYIKSSAVGSFKLSFSDFKDLDNTQSITLIDKFLNTTQDMRANQVYAFNVTSDTTSMGYNRFAVVVGAASTLPVNFTSISATKEGEKVNVRWSIANEVNIASYEVERSTNGTSFSTVTNKKAVGTTSYAIEDASIPAIATTLYYRIKAIGTDGTTRYSAIAKLITHNSSLSTIAVYPNPVKSKLNISLGAASGNYDVRITSVAGKEVIGKSAVTVTDGKLSLDASSLAAGVYVVELTDKEGNKYQEKFIKE